MTMFAKRIRRSILAVTLTFVSGASHAVPFDINLSFEGGLTDMQTTIFSNAEAYWESVITGYSSNRVPTGTTLDISASGVSIDGAGGILGQAGPVTGFRSKGTVYAATGVMQFDSEDLLYLELNGLLEDVILHEMAHVIGFGTLWDLNGVYAAGSGAYSGTNALSACKLNSPDICGADALFVPVELDGGSGTADGHWDEALFTNELMTGFIDSNNFISDMSVCSFADIGYTVGVNCGVADKPKGGGGGGPRGGPKKIQVFDLVGMESNLSTVSEPSLALLLGLALVSVAATNGKRRAG
jgi:hypothetical protein